jgi:hypothetical protein
MIPSEPHLIFIHFDVTPFLNLLWSFERILTNGTWQRNTVQFLSWGHKKPLHHPLGSLEMCALGMLNPESRIIPNLATVCPEKPKPQRKAMAGVLI